MIIRLMKDGMTNGVHDHKKNEQLAMFQIEKNQYGKKGFAARLLGSNTRPLAFLAVNSGSNRWAVNHRGAKRKIVEFGLNLGYFWIRNTKEIPYAARY